MKTIKIKLKDKFLEDFNTIVGGLPYNYIILTPGGHIPLSYVMENINKWNEGDLENHQQLEGLFQVLLHLPYNIIKDLAEILLSDERWDIYLERTEIPETPLPKKHEKSNKSVKSE